MVSRCGFYVSGNRIVQKNISIDWDLGFTREAKHEYIKRIIDALGDVGKCSDVTSASPIYKDRMLSPIFVRMISYDKSVEDFYQENIKPEYGYIPGLMEYIYILNLSEDEIRHALTIDCYIDVFHNPDKRQGCTQALALAILRWMAATDKTNVISSLESFLEWYKNIPLDIVNS